MSSRSPRNRTPASDARAHLLGREGVWFVGIVGADHDHEVTVAEGPGGLDQLEVPLLRHQSPDGADHHLVGRCSELQPRPFPLVGAGRRAEAAEVDAVAEQERAAPRVQPPPHEQRQILGVLDQLGVGEAGGDALEREHGGASGALAVADVQTVVRVHHDRHPGEPSDDAAVDTGLGVVGVDDVEALRPQDPPQVDRGPHVGGHVPPAGRRRQGDVADAVALERLDPGPGSADPDHLATLAEHGQQLRAQQVPQRRVDGCDMGDADRGARGGGAGHVVARSCTNTAAS